MNPLFAGKYIHIIGGPGAGYFKGFYDTETRTGYTAAQINLKHMADAQTYKHPVTEKPINAVAVLQLLVEVEQYERIITDPELPFGDIEHPEYGRCWNDALPLEERKAKARAEAEQYWALRRQQQVTLEAEQVAARDQA